MSPYGWEAAAGAAGLVLILALRALHRWGKPKPGSIWPLPPDIPDVPGDEITGMTVQPYWGGPSIRVFTSLICPDCGSREVECDRCASRFQTPELRQVGWYVFKGDKGFFSIERTEDWASVPAYIVVQPAMRDGWVVGDQGPAA